MKQKIFIVIAYFGILSGSFGFVLDWDTVDWNAGVTSQTFRNVDGSGVDIQVTLSISSGQWVDNTPDDSNYYDGKNGHNNGDESLKIYADYLNNSHTNSYVDVVIRFSESQTNVGFSLFDVDRGKKKSSDYQFEDIIENIEASYQGNNVNSHSVTVGNQISIDDQSDSGDILYRGSKNTSDSKHSVVGISWANQPVNQIGFRYSSGSGAMSDPTGQSIGLSDISFSSVKPVPEASTMTMGALLIFGTLVLHFRKKRKIKSDC